MTKDVSSATNIMSNAFDVPWLRGCPEGLARSVRQTGGPSHVVAPGELIEHEGGDVLA
jgi:hypothetical protein